MEVGNSLFQRSLKNSRRDVDEGRDIDQFVQGIEQSSEGSGEDEESEENEGSEEDEGSEENEGSGVENSSGKKVDISDL